MKVTPLICILYDSITNSVFQGQVLTPLRLKLANKQAQEIIIISFEKSSFSQDEIDTIIPPHPAIQVIILKRPAFWRQRTLSQPINTVKAILHKFTTYRILARGPLAGFIAMHAARTPDCISLTIQARGLLAAEYAFTHRTHKNPLKRLLTHLRMKQYQAVERATYHRKHTKPFMNIEAVSTALRDYLVTTFQADPRRITLAQDDLPSMPTPVELAAWRTEIRNHLGLTPEQHVYCYNGSLKPWQCPQETVTFFMQRYAQNSTSFLLILTPDVKPFKALLENAGIPTTAYHVTQVAHHAIYRYLAASDTGIIFREQDPINWVSRPTKVLEYQAAKLAIVHNNTIAFLTQPIAHTTTPMDSE